ncbi:MAG: hypothetical protein DMF68_20005 [Acidobacteria bacterium]|nr:MAG: hypothetical protein DMF68_20005 [Acidobacteriota bacterium]
MSGKQNSESRSPQVRIKTIGTGESSKVEHSPVLLCSNNIALDTSTTGKQNPRVRSQNESG